MKSQQLVIFIGILINNVPDFVQYVRGGNREIKK
jgi:hypothetical protein